ncbi:MAG: M3 family oligoendopeptidase [Clostridiales bacterium]|jgi:pepF/M3 family oligoendopeptidase|nr:M3 family oligoendopeptidase [Clostridiales bacterium]
MMTWSLKELYTSFDSAEFKADMEGLEKEIRRFTAWAKENFASRDRETEMIEEALRILQGMERFYKLQSFANLSLSANSEDADAMKSLDKLQRMLAELSEPNFLFDEYVSDTADLDACAKASPLIAGHIFVLKETKEKSRYRLSEKEEALLAKLRITGSAAWAKMKEQLVSTLNIDVSIDGAVKTMSLSAVRNLARDERAAVREAAYHAELDGYKNVEKATAAALNAIKGEAITTARLRGYASPLEMTVLNSRMDMATLEAMLGVMRDYLPMFHTYYKKKAKLLGYEGGLPWHGIMAPVGSASTRFTIEEARDFIVTHFNTFSEKLGSFARMAFDKRWIDVYPRNGKRGGAFCATVPELRESRILTNFDGTLDATLTLAHELGHAYHGYCLKNASLLNKRYPMPLAETASTFCETLVSRAALKAADKDGALAIRENDLAGNAQVIVDIYSRFLFEDELFRRREKGPLTADELNALMTECQKEAYGDGLDHNVLNPGMWINKSHYYNAENNYYNFPYAYGQLFALGLYAQYLEEGSAFPAKYDAMLAETGRNDAAAVGRMMGIDVTSKDFWASSMEIIKREIEAL